MARRLLNLVINNIGLKLVSVLFAIILWLVVVNVDNPQTTVTFSTTASIINQNVITDNGKVYEILDNSNTIRFSVTGPRTIVEGLSSRDFSAIADMNKIDLSLGFIPVDVTAERYANKLTINVKTTNVRVSIENVKTRQYAISEGFSGEPEGGYALGEVICNPATVTITGPESLMARIDRVVASVEIEGIYADRTQTVIPTLYDENGSRITSANITLEPSSVQVTAKILQTKSVSIRCEDPENLPEGYSVESIVSLPETVMVKGSKEALAEFNEIVIPSSELNLSGVTESFEKKVNISSRLPEGIELVDAQQTTVVIQIELASKISRTLMIPVSQILFENLPEGLEVEFDQTNVEIQVEGEKAVINALAAGKIKLRLDFNGMEAGAFRLVPEADEITGVTSIMCSTVSGRLVDSNADVEPEDPGDEIPEN